MCDQPLDLLLHGVDAAAKMGNLLVGQQVLKISGCGALHHIQTLQPVQPQQLKADMPGCQFLQTGRYGLQFVVVPGLIERHQCLVQPLATARQKAKTKAEKLGTAFTPAAGEQSA